MADDEQPTAEQKLNAISVRRTPASVPWEAYGSPQGQPGGTGEPWMAFQQPASPSEPASGPWETFKAAATPLLKQAVEPFTSYPDTYTEMRQEAQKKMGEGVEQLGTPGERLKGAFNTGIGALQYTMSPIDAAVRSIAGRPIERATGIPKEYTEFATELAIPGIGLAGTAKGKAALRPLENILSPETVSPIAGEAAGSIRSAGGTAARETAQTEAAVEPFHAKINALPVPDRLNFIDYVEGRSGKFAGLSMRDPELQSLANTLKGAFDNRMARIQALPSTAQASFIEDYFPHFWQDPKKAAAVGQNFGGGVAKQGSGASLKKRTVPTVADGLAAGLVPVTSNPIEATLRYVRSMDHFIAAQEVLDTAKAQGQIRYFKPRVMGASGHPESFQGIPDGWVPVKGRGATRPDGSQAYAPEDWARVYNNFIDRGIHKNEDWGRIYDALQSTSNSITALELGLSGFHAFTMANEAIISGVAKGISELAGGKPIKAVGSISTAAIKPVTSVMRGKKMEQVYLKSSPGTPDLRKITDLLEKAGARAVGSRHAPDYRFSAMGSYWTAFKRGALRQQMTDSLANMKARPVVGTGQEAARLIGRTMETVAQPLFQTYIPRLKNGAFYDTMKMWLDANPKATQEQEVAMARRIWDSIDNRFGEMVQDNIFWNKTLKQVAQLGMRSYSWNLGTVREIAGGVRDLARNPSKLSPTSADYSPKAAYVVAMPIVVATLNAAYQYLMTGEAPESVDDLVAGRTGGTVPGFGARTNRQIRLANRAPLPEGQRQKALPRLPNDDDVATVDERVSMPGYQKDVIGWYLDWRQEAANKLATGPRTGVVDPLRDADWKGDPVFHEGTPWLQDYFSHVLQAMGPISIKSILQGRKKGSEIGPMQSLMGLRSAPAAIQDPEGYQKGMHVIKQQREKIEQNREKKQNRLYE